jgi:hypothetical protein
MPRIVFNPPDGTPFPDSHRGKQVPPRSQRDA